VSGAVVLVTAVGGAEGSRDAAAALACAASEPDRPALLLDVGGRSPRPTLFASSGARELEERIATHRPDFAAASRGQICQVAVAEAALAEGTGALLPLVRDSLAVVHMPPGAVRRALTELAPRLDGALLRADLERDRALVALAASALIRRGLAVRILRRPLAWIPARRALFGALPAEAEGGLPRGVRDRLLHRRPSPPLPIVRASP
jgi:hypothetical protein